jgi:hypothetical protein
MGKSGSNAVSWFTTKSFGYWIKPTAVFRTGGVSKEHPIDSVIWIAVYVESSSMNLVMNCLKWFSHLDCSVCSQVYQLCTKLVMIIQNCPNRMIYVCGLSSTNLVMIYQNCPKLFLYVCLSSTNLVVIRQNRPKWFGHLDCSLCSVLSTNLVMIYQHCPR